MPTPRQGESESEFMDRCIPYVVENEDKTPDVAIAICSNIWRNRNKQQKEEEKQNGEEKEEK